MSSIESKLNMLADEDPEDEQHSMNGSAFMREVQSPVKRSQMQLADLGKSRSELGSSPVLSQISHME
jgi:hypothetical protein